MLTAPELLTLIKGHNILNKIKVPAKARNDPEALEKLINKANYNVNHTKKRLESKAQRGKSTLSFKKAEELSKPVPKKELTSEQKEKKSMNEKKRVIKFILNNKEILNDPEVMKLHKGLK
jgi:hypothetical protein